MSIDWRAKLLIFLFFFSFFFLSSCLSLLLNWPRLSANLSLGALFTFLHQHQHQHISLFLCFLSFKKENMFLVFIALKNICAIWKSVHFKDIDYPFFTIFLFPNALQHPRPHPSSPPPNYLFPSPTFHAIASPTPFLHFHCITDWECCIMGLLFYFYLIFDFFGFYISILITKTISTLHSCIKFAWCLISISFSLFAMYDFLKFLQFEIYFLFTWSDTAKR